MVTSTFCGVLVAAVAALAGQAPAGASPVTPSAQSDEAQPRAEPGTATTDAAPPGAATTGEAPRRLRVLVLEPSTSGNAEDVAIAKAVSGLVPVELSAVTGFDVLSSADVQQMIELEAEKEAIGCADSSCLAELAGALGADLVVFGDVNRLGALILVNLNLFDSTRTAAAGRVSIQTRTIEELPAKLIPGIRQLVRPFLEKQGHAVPDAWDLPVAEAATASPAEEPGGMSAASQEGGAEGGPGLLPWTLVGAGAVVAFVGAAVMAAGAVPWGLALYAVSSASTTTDPEAYFGAKALYQGVAGWAAPALIGGAAVGGVVLVAGALLAGGGGAWVVLGGGE